MEFCASANVCVNTVGVAVLDEHTRLTRLETDAAFLPALSAAADIDLVHPFFGLWCR